MDPDEDLFVASRVSLQSRRERLAKRSTEQSTQDAPRFLPSDDNHNADASLLPDAYSTAPDGGCSSTGRVRRQSETRQPTNCSTGRDREYVQPKIVDHCDVVALSLIQSSSILSMEEQSSGHPKCNRTLSGEGSMVSLRRTMPAKLRASLSSERGLLDNSNTADPLVSLPLRRTSVDSTNSVPAANGGAGESSLLSSVTNGKLRRQSSSSYEAVGAAATGSFGWMPGNSTSTSGPAHTAEADEIGYGDSKRPLESTLSEESREERIARIKELRRRSKHSQSFMSGTNDEREITGSTTKRWHSVDDEQQQQQQSPRRGSGVFYDPRRPSSLDAGRSTSITSSFSDSTASDLSSVGVSTRRESHSADGCSAASPPLLKPELIQPGVPTDAVERAGADTAEAVTPRAVLSPLSPGSASHRHSQLVGISEVQVSDLNCVASASTTNPRRNSVRRRRSNLLADVEQADATSALLEVPAEAESGDAGAESVSVVTRPRRRRATAEKTEGAESGGAREGAGDSGNQVLWQQWQQLTSPRGAASPLSTQAAALAATASTPERSIGKPSRTTTAAASSAERSSAEHSEPDGVRSEKADRRRAAGSGDAHELPSDDAARAPKLSAARSASPAAVRRADEDELRNSSAAAAAQPATSVASTSAPASLLGSGDLRLVATVVESAAGATCDNQAVEAEAKANPTGISLPGTTTASGATTAAVPPGTDSSGVASTTTPAQQNKKRSEKKNAALGLILQKFEAANVLPPALAAAIGLPSPTMSSADSSQPKPTPLVKTGKVESTIKQMAAGQLTAEPSSVPHVTEKAATHSAHPAASVGSLVRKFAGAASPPTSLHLSLLSSTDGSDAAITASKSSTSPVRPASPAAGIPGDAAGGSRQPHQHADGGGSSGSRPPSPKVGGWPPVGTGVRSGHSSPGSARRSPVSAASPAAFAHASNVTDSDASSQLTDDGQHSDVASGRRHAGVPALKQHLQSPEKLQSQQPPYFSAIGKKPPKAAPTPVALSVTPAEAADEPTRAHGRLYLAAGRHEEDLGIQYNANSAASSLEAAGSEVTTDADDRQLLPFGGAKQMQTEAINSVHEASSTGLVSPDDELAAAAVVAVTVAAGEAPVDAQHRSLADDLRSSSACQQQPQTFAKLRAAPPPPPNKPSSSAKSEPSQPLLDPQLATILQARLKKAESKGQAAIPPPRPGNSSSGLHVHDEQQHGKSAGRDGAVDRSAHSIKDRAQYFMQMQQKALGATDASLPVGARPSAGQAVLTKQPSFSAEHDRNDDALGVHSRPTTAHHTDTGQQESSTDPRPSQSGDSAADPAIAVADSAVQQAERCQQKSSKKERRRDRRRRGSLHGGREHDRWQTQPVTDSEVLVAASVVVRGQPGSVVLAADGLVQPDGSGLPASAPPGFAGANAVQSSGVGVGDDVDEVRRLAVMTLEEKIGLFMDRSVAWSNCTDAEAVAVSPDRSIRHLPKGEMATSRKYRRCAWLGRFSTQPVSPAEVHRALRVLGSSALVPPAELSAELNSKIERLCLQLAEHQHADKQSAGAVVSQRQDKAGRSVVRRSAGNGKKVSVAADPNVSLHLNGSNESQAQHARKITETGRRAVSGSQRKGAARPTSLIADRQSSSLLHAEQNGGSPEVHRTDSEGISRGSNLRQSQRAPAPAIRSKTSEKPAKARPVSMNFDLSAHADTATTHGVASPETDPARGTASVKSAVSRQRPHSAKAAVTTQGLVRKDDATKSNGVAAVPSSASDARRASTNKGHEKKEKISQSEIVSRGGAERAGAPHDVPPASEQLTWADKSKSQPCISTMEDDGAEHDLPSYMRATSSYARKVEHLLMESDDEEESSNACLAPDNDKSSLDALRHDPGPRTTFQRAVSAVADGAATRASVRRTLGSRLSVGAPLESPTSGHSSDVPSYARATKAVSMRDIRSTAGKPSPSTEEPTSTAVGVRKKRSSVDGSRTSLPPPQRPASVTTGDQSASGESDGSDDDDDDDDELPSYMRATKSFARKVEHLIESCDEDDEDAVATTRRDECSDAGDRASSSRRSPAPRRSRTPSTHGGSDLTPSEPYAPSTRDTSKQLDSDGGNDRSQKRKPLRSATSRNASSTSLHADGPAAHQEYVPELSSPGAAHGPSSGRTAEAVTPIVDGRKRKAKKASETLTQSAVLAEVNGNHKAEAVTAHAKPSQHQGKDKHALLGGDLPSFMRATKSSTTKDRHQPGSTKLPEHPSKDVVKSTKVPLTEPIGKHHGKGQGSRESLCSTGANSSRAESGHHSSSESAEHAHVAPIPLAPVSNIRETTTTSKSRKTPSSRTSANMGVVPRHKKLPIGAAGGAVG